MTSCTLTLEPRKKNLWHSIESWFVNRDPFNGLIIVIPIYLGSIIPFITQPTRVFFIGHLTRTAWHTRFQHTTDAKWIWLDFCCFSSVVLVALGKRKTQINPAMYRLVLNKSTPLYNFKELRYSIYQYLQKKSSKSCFFQSDTCKRLFGPKKEMIHYIFQDSEHLEEVKVREKNTKNNLQ